MLPADVIVPVVVEVGDVTMVALVRLKLLAGVADELMPHQSTAQPSPYRPAQFCPGHDHAPISETVTLPSAFTIAVADVFGSGLAAFASAGATAASWTPTTAAATTTPTFSPACLRIELHIECPSGWLLTRIALPPRRGDEGRLTRDAAARWPRGASTL